MRDTAIRTALLARIQPLVDRLARDLAALAEKRIEAEIERVGEVFEVALSAYASDDAPDLVTRLGPDVVHAFGPELAQAFASPDYPRSVRPRGFRRSAKPANVDHEEPVECPRVVPASEPPDGQSADQPAPRLRSDGKRIGAIVCKKCGYVGGNARGCGRSHPTQQREVQTPPASSEAPGDDSEDEPAAAPRRITRNLQATYDMITRAQAGDQAAMTELVRQNIGLVHWVARRHAWSSVPYEDMVQEGLMGLVEALKRFDVSRGLKLTTYATHWIRHFVGRAHDNDGLIRLPVASQEQLRLVRRAEHKAGPGAPIEEVAQRSGLSVKSVQRLLERGTVTQPATLPDAVAPTDDGDEERIELAREQIAALPERLRRVMELRYSGDGMTLHEVGSVLGVSRERVRQLEVAAVRAIRAKCCADERTAS